MTISKKMLSKRLSLPNFCFTFLCSWAFCTEMYSQTHIHIVLPGDKLYRIARHYNTTPKQIAKLNGMDSITQPLLAYQYLIIPEKYYEVNRIKDRNIQQIRHNVREGESLFSIARMYRTTVYDILLRNPNIKRGEPLQKDEKILVYVSPSNKSQISEQIIFLNSDEIKLDTVQIRDTAEYRQVQELNKRLQIKINGLLEERKNRKIVVDTLPFPTSDHSELSTILYNLLLTSDDTTAEVMKDLEALENEILYLPYREKRRKQNVQTQFVNQLFSLFSQKSDIHPDNELLLSIRALLYFWAKSPAKAAILAEELLYLHPNHPTASAILATILCEEGNYRESISENLKLFEKYATRQFVIYNLATSYYKSNQFAEAIRYYEYLSKANTTPDIHYRIGHSYYLLDNPTAACEFLKLAKNKGHKRAAALYGSGCK